MTDWRRHIRMTAPTTVARITGRANLRKARFFLRRLAEAERLAPLDREAAETYLEAAIIFGKATQDWMKDEFGGVPWLKASPLWNDPLCKFFADVRDVIVHDDGSVEVLARTSATL